LSYDGKRQSALAIDDNLIILNSFSKYFNMTGWRLGWMIVPTHMVEPIEKMAASLAICAPTLAQHGAIACFSPDALALFEQRREAFRQRRDFLVPALKALNIDVPVTPDGAFYVYGDISAHSPDSSAFSAASRCCSLSASSSLESDSTRCFREMLSGGSWIGAAKTMPVRHARQAQKRDSDRSFGRW
jgi:aspartate/methionine/tyrosine aminotransferase